MALKQCPECSSDVSEYAATCPKCAFPISGTQSQNTNSNVVMPVNTKNHIFTINNVFKFALVVGIIFFVTSLISCAGDISSAIKLSALSFVGAFIVGLIVLVGTRIIEFILR